METNTIVEQIMKAQEMGTPLAVYRKTILGKVVVRILDPFSGKPNDVLIHGEPGKTANDDLEVCLWTPVEIKFFEKYNKSLIEKGSVVLVGQKSENTIDRTNSLNDQEITDLLSGNYAQLKSTVNQLTSETTLQRVLRIATEMNRPAKTIQMLQERIEEVQQNVGYTN